jgi:hypothetical protein
MNVDWIRRQLYEWGMRNRARGIGYPTMAATEKAIRGRGGAYREPDLPEDLEAVDRAVRALESDDRRIIAECYTHYGTHEDHMGRLRMPARTYCRRKNRAEIRVITLLQRGSEFLHCA